MPTAKLTDEGATASSPITSARLLRLMMTLASVSGLWNWMSTAAERIERLERLRNDFITLYNYI